EFVGSYRKLHLPEEEGFWETSHYDPGDRPPSVIHGLPLPIGIQICSDVNRPEGSHLLGALGAELIVCPRATEAATFARWKTVLTANAITSCTYVISVPRPQPEFGVPLGGPSFRAGIVATLRRHRNDDRDELSAHEWLYQERRVHHDVSIEDYGDLCRSHWAGFAKF